MSAVAVASAVPPAAAAAATGLRRRLLVAGVALTAFELLVDALLLFFFLGLERDLFWAASIALAPVVLVSAIYFLALSSRWMRGLGDPDLETAREAVVRFPRRTMLFRSFAAALTVVVLAPGLAVALGVGASAAAVISGTVALAAFGNSVLRASVYRYLLADYGAALFEGEPLRYTARLLRERLFVSTNLPGFVAAACAVVYLHELVGLPASHFAQAASIAPVAVGVLVALAGWDMLRVTAPLLPFLVPERHEARTDPATALRIAGSAPFRMAGSVFVSWVLAGLASSLHETWSGVSRDVAWQTFGGVTAMGLGCAMYQAAWHREILKPVREAAARALVESGAAPQRSRLSLRTKLALAFLTLLAFGGSFGLLTALTEHERFLTAAATAEAASTRDALSRTAREALLASPSEASSALASIAPEGGGAFLVRGRDVERAGPLRLPEAALPFVLAAPDGVQPLADERASIAWTTLAPGTLFGVVRPWRSPEPGRSVRAVVFVFVALAFASAGIVLLAVNELSGPARQLSRQAERMGRGDLTSPITPPEADEMGELANTLEVARRELQKKIASIEELNSSLEEKVRARTAELEAANEGLTRALRELHEARDQVVTQEKMASLGRLVAGIAHELNNPLNFVQNGLPPLRESIDALGSVVAALPDAEAAQEARAKLKADDSLDDARDLLRVMDNGVSRMAAIVRALRDFSHHAPDRPPEPVALERLVDDAAALLRHAFGTRIRLVKALASPSTVLVEPGPLTQVLVNLLKNGAQAIDGEGTLTVRSRVLERTIELDVTDTGRGMPPEVRARLFEPFFTTKPVGEGTGLGLAIVHGIVEKHGGRITVQSEPGKGTTFTLVLPRAGGSS